MTRRHKRALFAATAMALAACGFAAPAAARTNHALLVAVTAYPNLPPKASLVGPNHDAVLVRDYLTSVAPVAFDPGNVTLLASDLPGASDTPTHEHILSALRGIAAKAERGDFVYLHLSGHGAQQPETRAGSETDGLDEIFLPADTDRWTDQAKGVPNALMDDEIGGALDAIRDKGAFVWIVFDACHSGSATRDVAPSEEQERKVEFEELGVPQEAVAAATSGKEETGEAERKPGFALGDKSEASRAVTPGGADQSATGAAATGKGGLVAFFAAQTIETTPEMPLPKGQPDAERYGLFTYTIFSKLAENPNMTYRQLGHAVLQQYQADARQRPTPLFEGELDARVFGSEPIDTVMQWPVEVKDGKGAIQAGLLHRITPGTKLAVLPSPASERKDTIAYLEVRSAKNLSSIVAPVAHDGKSAVQLADLPANAYARLADLAIDFAVTVARPAASDGMDGAVALVNQMLDSIDATPDKRFSIKLAGPGEQADLRLAVMEESAADGTGATSAAASKPALFFLPPSGQVSVSGRQKPPLIAIDPSAPERLADGMSDNLTRIFRALGVSRLAAASDYQPDQVSVRFMIKREGTEAMEPLDPAGVPVVHPGDEVHIAAENKSGKLVDINVLYVGSDYSITHIDAQRLVNGAKLEEGLLAFTDTSFGMERMIAVLTEAPPMSEVEDLSFLQQGGVPRTTRSAGGDGPAGFSAVLADIGVGQSTRSVMKLGDKSGPKGAVMIFPIETMPRK